MVLEIADIRIRAGQQAAFEAAIQQGLRSVLAKSPGVEAWRVRRCHETPERYVLEVEWRTLEDHTVGFRESDLFRQWRALVGPFFDGPPNVEHFDLVASSEGGA